MDRKTKILMKALNDKDETTMRQLQIPKYETTKGLNETKREILLRNRHKLLDPDHEKPLKQQEPSMQDLSPSRLMQDSVAELQSPRVSSTKKLFRYETRLIAKRKLFNENDEEKENKPDNDNISSAAGTSSTVSFSDITSSVNKQIDGSPFEPYESSEDEYVPNSSEESISSCDTNISIEIPEASQIIVDPNHTNPLYRPVFPDNSDTQHEHNVSGHQNTSKGNINERHFQESFTNDELSQSDQNLRTQVSINNSRITKTTKAKRVWNKRDYCVFCDTEVLKFSRHVLRHHEQETEVQQILAYNVRDRKRKHLFNKLRNAGNFLKSTIAHNNVIPVRQPVNNDAQTDIPNVSTYLPCKFCRGFYKRKYLYRHVKKCPHNDKKSETINAQSEGQSLFFAYNDNDLLRKEVFPIMRADEISFTAKTDPIICAVAERYLKSHRDKQFRLVASRKMRQLAQLLIEIKKKKPVKNLLEALDPVNFDIIVECTKIIARFDSKTATYGAPSLASHMGTELKDCIDVGYNMSLKLHHRETEKGTQLKTLKELISTEWRYEVSTIANNDSQQKKWNKPTLIPLAEDLTLVRKYLLEKSEELRGTLNQNPSNVKAFKSLQEVCYVQLLLLNRRRVGELQRMTVNSYTSNIDNKNITEFDNCISKSEKALMRSFKRVVIKGKRGRGVPVLFTEEMVETINLLLKVRANFVQNSNIYLFANTKTSSSIDGSKAVYTHVRRAGPKNATALTSTKLRKHLATMSQVINLSKQDLEQLASFMGHTADIHKSCYRLPNDVYQMAKVSKLLILNEKGEAYKYRGKTLDEIDIDLNAVEENSDEDDEEEEIPDRNQASMLETADDESTRNNLPNVKKKDTSQKKQKRILEPWTEEQKEVTLAFFAKHLKKRIPPKKLECEKLREENDGLFNNKSWEKIKIFVVNNYSKK